MSSVKVTSMSASINAELAADGDGRRGRLEVLVSGSATVRPFIVSPVLFVNLAEHGALKRAAIDDPD
jgi:hypothetical protein